MQGFQGFLHLGVQLGTLETSSLCGETFAISDAPMLEARSYDVLRASRRGRLTGVTVPRVHWGTV